MTTFYVGIVDRAKDGWGVTVPDLPGCTSAGGNMDDLFAMGIEAVRLWIDDALGEGEPFPKARTIEELEADVETADTIREIGPVSFIQVPALVNA